MRDFRASYPDRECVEGFVVTDRKTVMMVQGFALGPPESPTEMLWCPEYGYSILRTRMYADFEEAKAAAIKSAEESVTWAEESLERAKALTPADC